MDMTPEYVIDSVNEILKNERVRQAESLKQFEDKIQKHIKDNLDVIVNQTWEINDQANKHRDESIKREQDLRLQFEKQHLLMNRVQNACILFAAGRSNTLHKETCHDTVTEFERMFKK